MRLAQIFTYAAAITVHFTLSVSQPPNNKCGPHDNADDCEALCDLYTATGSVLTGWCNGKTYCEWGPKKGTVHCGHYTVTGMRRVHALSLGSSNLKGTIPSTLGKLGEMKHLELEQNQLSGTVPESLGRLTQLKVVWLDRNQLSGSIPESLSNIAQLHSLVLYGNGLTSFPESICKLSVLFSDKGTCDLSFNLIQKERNGHCPLPTCGSTCKAACVASVDHRNSLVALYTKRDPSKLANLDFILKKYADQETLMWQLLQQKYGQDARPPPQYGQNPNVPPETVATDMHDAKKAPSARVPSHLQSVSITRYNPRSPPPPPAAISVTVPPSSTPTSEHVTRIMPSTPSPTSEHVTPTPTVILSPAPTPSSAASPQSAVGVGQITVGLMFAVSFIMLAIRMCCHTYQAGSKSKRPDSECTLSKMV